MPKYRKNQIVTYCSGSLFRVEVVMPGTDVGLRLTMDPGTG